MMLSRYGWAALADKEGFIVVAPEGLPLMTNQSANFLNNPRVWRSGPARRRLLAASVDDVKFTRELLDELKSRVPYDEERVFATGHSNGGGMSFKLGADLLERFAALGMVAGTMDLVNPRPKKPLPTLYILGTNDPLVPLEGGEVKLPWFTRQNPPVAESLEKWAAALGCERTPKTVSDEDGLKRVEYASQKGETKLTVMYIEGHGHHWPGAGRSLPANLIGPITEKLDATETIWKFFERDNADQD
jgi:polyhydroxybutyrate depolymerase